MKTKEICDKLKITQKALRVYEDAGLLTSGRDENNYRNYTYSDVVRLNSIKNLKEIGFKLSQIKLFLNALDNSSQQIDVFLTSSLQIQLEVMNEEIKKYNKSRCDIVKIINNILSNSFDFSHQNLDLVLSNISEVSSVDMGSTLEKFNFDEMADNYIKRYLVNDDGYCNAMTKLKTILSDYSDGHSIIDVGCGVGNLWYEWDRKSNLTLVDKSLNMLMACKRNVIDSNLFLVDISDPLGAEFINKYDIVVSTFMFHHIPYEKQKVSMENTLKLLKPNGKLLVLDRGFYNDSEMETILAKKRDQNDENYLKRVIYEYYLNITKTFNYLTFLGYNPVLEKWQDEIYCFRINI